MWHSCGSHVAVMWQQRDEQGVAKCLLWSAHDRPALASHFELKLCDIKINNTQAKTASKLEYRSQVDQASRTMHPISKPGMNGGQEMKITLLTQSPIKCKHLSKNSPCLPQIQCMQAFQATLFSAHSLSASLNRSRAGSSQPSHH